MDKLATLGTQDTGRWGNQVRTNWQHWVHKTQDDEAIKYRQTGNIGYTRHRTMGQSSTDKLATLGTQDTGRWGNQVRTNWQHWVHKTQDDGAIKYGQTGNIGYTRHRTMRQSSMDKLATLGTQDTGRWGNQVRTNWQHWEHKTQDDGAIKYGQTGNIGCTRHRTMGQSSTDKLATLGTQDTGR